MGSTPIPAAKQEERMTVLGEPFDVRQVQGNSLITSTYVEVYDVHPSLSAAEIVRFTNTRDPVSVLLLQEVTETVI
jgi:hypothetical protein